jgi:PAS domain S-box-containing protein
MSSSTPHLLLIGGTDDDASWVHRALVSDNGTVRLERLASGDDPRALLTSARFDAILIDLYSSAHDARGWLALLDEVGRRVPLVVMADARQESEVVGWLATGASDWVFRPGLLGLSAVLARLLREAREEAAEEERDRRLREATAGLVELTRSPVFRGDDLAAKFRQINRLCTRTIGVDRCGVWLYSEDRSALCLADAFDASTGVHSYGTQLLRADHPAYFEALGSSRVIAAAFAQADPRTREFAELSLRPHGVSSTLDVALTSRGELVGVLCAGHRGAPRRWSAAEEVFTTALADVASLSLEAADRSRVEIALAASERRFREIFHSSSDSIVLFRVSAEGRVFCEDINPAAEQSTGYRRDDVVGKEVHEVLPPRSAERVTAQYQRAIRERRPVADEMELEVMAGVRTFNTAVIPMLDDSGRVYRLASVARDVTSQRTAQQLAQELDAHAGESRNGEGLDRLATTLAREVLELLSVIDARAQQPTADEVTAALADGTARCRALAHRISGFGPDASELRRSPSLEPLAGNEDSRRHLMLVDDHPGMARVSARLLETIGYRTTVFDDPRLALEAFRRQPTGFDAVLTDLSMPQMSGEDFTRSLHQVRPSLPVIVSSGLATSLDDLKRFGAAAMLVKPWRLEQAVATLDRIFSPG